MKTMEDSEDIGLKAVMGDHFEKFRNFENFSQEVRKEAQEAATVEKLAPEARQESTVEGAQDAKWAPVRGPRTDLERLEASCKAMLPYAGACAVLWWWQIDGALDAGVSQAASTLCAVIASMAATRAWFKP